MAGYEEGIRRALVLGVVLIAGTVIVQALPVGPPWGTLFCHVGCYNISLTGGYIFFNNYFIVMRGRFGH